MPSALPSVVTACLVKASATWRNGLRTACALCRLCFRGPHHPQSFGNFSPLCRARSSLQPYPYQRPLSGDNVVAKRTHITRNVLR